ncbi:hypothetical protein LCGC14_0305960 [marine sediment metagenome]|uniref:Uncharacterized protein n=1 Tax=marine sediment metagenome TaxID=412755 RepID=A0A0F9U669_9ZZZZ
MKERIKKLLAKILVMLNDDIINFNTYDIDYNEVDELYRYLLHNEVSTVEVRDKNEIPNMVKDELSKIAKITLSVTEAELLDFIKASEDKVTIKLIEEKLGKSFTGALGKLLGKELIESKKYREDFSPLSPTKMIKYYAIKERIKQ